MAKLKVKTTSLEKARLNFEKVNRRGIFNKELEIRFERSQNSFGRYNTGAKIHIRTQEYHYRPEKWSGLLHDINNVRQSQITGDIPSLSKKIDSLQPRTLKGHAAKLTLKTANFTVRNTRRLAWSTALAAETAAISGARAVGGVAKSAVTSYANRTAQDDGSKMVFKTFKFAKDARNGIKIHLKEKQRFGLQKAKYRLQKEELKHHLSVKYKPQIKEIKLRKKAAYKSLIPHSKDRLKTAKLNLKKTPRFSSSYNQKRGLVRARELQLDVKKIEYKAAKTELKFKKKQLMLEKRFMVKDLKGQLKLTKQSKPDNLVVKSAKYSIKGMAASAWQKAAVADDRNDTAKAADKVYEVYNKVQHKRIRAADKTQKQKGKLYRKNQHKQKKLQKKNSKLQKKSSLLDAKAKKKRVKSPSKKKKAKAVAHAVSIPLRSFAVFVAVACGVVVTMTIILQLFSGVINSIFGNSDWVVGTYNAQDIYLSQAESYYTECAKSFNDKLLMVGSYDDWKSGLKKFDVDTSDYEDKPDIIEFGRCSDLDYDPNYDFNKYKLWAFLCAYFYEFSEDDSGSGKDIKYWKFNDDVKDIIDEIFNDEYAFEHKYYNASRWEELEPYNYWGGGFYEDSWEYYRCSDDIYLGDGDKYRYKFKPITIEDQLAEYEDGEGYIYIDDDFRVLDPNHKYKVTGFYIMDQRYPAGTQKTFYAYDEDADSYYFKDDDGNKHWRSSVGWGEGEDRIEAWFIISPTDVSVLNSELTDGLYGFYEKYSYETDCKLYYNVKQKKSFDKVIEDRLKELPDGEERFNYYNIILGTAEGSRKTRGNHQNFECPLAGNIADYEKDGKILHGYGYDMAEWNTTHCDIDDEHQAIDIICPNNSEIIAGIDGVVDEISNDPTENVDLIVIRHDSFNYWYDGDGKGKKRDTKIYYYNVKTDLSEGDTVKAGDVIGKSLPQGFCAGEATNTGEYYIHVAVEIDTDGIGWGYIDPIIVFK